STLMPFLMLSIFCPVLRLNVLEQRIGQCGQMIVEPANAENRMVEAAASVEILDPTAIEALEDVDLARELITLFIEHDAPTILNDLKQAVQAGNCTMVKHHAHTLRGSSSALGLQSLANCCLATETKAKANELQDLGDLVTQIEHQFELACSALQKLLQSLC
ncbi:Hpt domain-containing protein, partial [Tumidithrix elongata RA019]|nr:Hpt domain-containing protein [Tumidithrix elongata RA019]